jgi:hypothetical protein
MRERRSEAFGKALTTDERRSSLGNHHISNRYTHIFLHAIDKSVRRQGDDTPSTAALIYEADLQWIAD